MKYAQTAADAGTPNSAANVAVLVFIYAYSPCYNMGYNALTYSALLTPFGPFFFPQVFSNIFVLILLTLPFPFAAYMVEVWPYTERSRGIAIFQLFGRLAGFFTTFVNPIGLDGVGWRYLISYCCWLAFEVAFVYFMFPETFGRTLEELAFSKYHSYVSQGRTQDKQENSCANIRSVFEDKKLADEAVKATEKVLAHHEGDDSGKAMVTQTEVKI